MVRDTDRAVDRRVELTLRGLILGAAITLVFTAANIYLGLKVGLTFASTIPAAVISMAVLRFFKNSSIYENNIVQTVASAAGTLSAIIFVLPGLVMVGWWSGFPFWEAFGICAIGGTLGVMYSVPLRRALVSQSDLPYPEGVAAAEVLKVAQAGDAETIEHNKAGLLALVVGSIVSAGFALISATRLFVSSIAGYFRAGAAATGFGFNLSFALIGAGHLIGLSVGLAMLVGLIVAWGIATPILTALHPSPGTDVTTFALTIWQTKVRFIGAGAIGIAAIWTLGKLAIPVYNGVTSAIAASRHRATAGAAALPRSEQDIPIVIVALISALLLIPLAVLLGTFLSGTALAPSMVTLTLAAILYVVVAGFLVAAACGYMAGLIGSSNSPVSGLAILGVIGASLLLLLLADRAGAGASQALVAYALFVTAVVVGVATIANDNLQDLKTGQLVDATPWRQQTALIVGVVMGALVIPPILDMLNRAYGFAGAPNLHLAAGSQPLPAPQATLISALARGVIQGQIDWSMIGTGVIVGVVMIVVDELLRKKGRQLPPLAVGLGIYLNATTIAPIVLGATLGHFYNRWANNRSNAEKAKQLGVLVASGLIVGESIFGVIQAGVIIRLGNPTPFAVVGDAFQNVATVIGAIAFFALIAGLYRWAAALSTATNGETR